MFSLVVPNMTILHEENTKGVSVIASTYSNSEILIGHENGDIHLWQFINMIHSYIDDKVPIIYIHPINHYEFISVNKQGVIKIWDKYSCIVRKKIFLSWWKPDYFAMLPGNLLALTKFATKRSQTIEVWDVRSGFCMHKGFQNCSGSRGMPLGVTTAGYLVAAATCGGEMRVWDICRGRRYLVCKIRIEPIYSLAVLPTNEIITAARDIIIYKLTQYGEIFRNRLIEHRNIIDFIIPVGGYKFMTVDRSRNHAGVLKLWCTASDKHEYLGHSKNTGTPKLVSSWYNVIYTSKEDRLVVKHFESNKLGYSRNLAEIRKNVRILAQAVRTSNFISMLPVEILIKIAVMTAPKMDQIEKKVCSEFAWSHFCRPHFSEAFIK